ncbi:MAG: maleylpyruvate isomerase N-terminal domain-containing protein [Acidimicrobiales bacterium]|nr:maleylpyruvate isomerase N-terminal domain-containing protein [Acidimicrobiales bacterium]
MNAPSEPPVSPIAPLFELERTRLLELLNDLGDDDWQRPTSCPGWTVLDLVAHLLGDDVGLISRKRDNYSGVFPDDNISEDGFIDWLDDFQISWVRAARRASPRLVTELLEWTAPRLVSMFDAQDLTARSAHVTWAGPDLAPVWLDQLRELSEYWIHRQQILEAVDRPIDLDAVLLRPILLGLRWAWPYRLSLADADVQGAIQIRIGDPIGEQWTLTGRNGDWQFTDDSADDVIVHASLTADQAWRMLTSNLREPFEQLDISGDPRIVDVLRNTRAIIGHPK